MTENGWETKFWSVWKFIFIGLIWVFSNSNDQEPNNNNEIMNWADTILSESLAESIVLT